MLNGIAADVSTNVSDVVLVYDPGVVKGSGLVDDVGASSAVEDEETSMDVVVGRGVDDDDVSGVEVEDVVVCRFLDDDVVVGGVVDVSVGKIQKFARTP